MSAVKKSEIISGIKQAHDDHKEMLECLGRLRGLVGTGASRDDVEEILQDLHIKAKHHFAMEDNFMEKFDYPGAHEHRQQHRALLHSLAGFLRRFESEEFVILSNEMVEYLENWLLPHITSADFDMAAFCQGQGVKTS